MFFRKSWDGEARVTTVLRALDRGRMDDAVRALQRAAPDGPVIPPHALWRIARWCLEKGRRKDARCALELFLGWYPRHQDRELVLRDLARTDARRPRATGRPVLALVRS